MGESLQNRNIIVTRNLNFSYGNVYALKSVNLVVPEGCIYGFLGPNGAGKTTMIKAILGLLHISPGTFDLFGMEFRSNRVKILERTGSMVETPSLYPALTGYENVDIVRRIRGLGKSETWKVIDTVGMRKDALRKSGQYSTGMKQRLALAIALLGNPELLLLDEPMNGLDPSGIIEVREFLLKLNREKGVTVFISSHILSEIEKMATHIGIISGGILKFQGTYNDLSAKFMAGRVNIMTGNNPEAIRITRASGFKVIPGKKGFILQVADEKEVAAAVRLIASGGIDIFEVVPSGNDLEDIFVDIINN
jgi:ABC-2 type transport system ATP-binding protein